MPGQAYSIFDTAIGRCAIAWGDAGIVGVHLPEAREIDTRRQLFHLYPDARESKPTPNSEAAIDGIVVLLRGGEADFPSVMLDMHGVHGFDQRV
jgi:methylated-DNA-[protein]-cysteine S-methyltransferase